MNYFVYCLQHYVDFKGRARRKEFWMFVLFNAIIGFILSWIPWNMTFGYASVGVLSTIWNLFTLLPGLAVGVRRLHDIAKGGGWVFLAFIPVIGAIVLIVFWAMEGHPGDNRFGENPKERELKEMQQ